MNKEEYKELLKDPRWKTKRNKIIKRDKHKCIICGRSYRLQVHHKVYKTINPWDADDKDLITLCYLCHEKVHINNVKIESANFNTELQQYKNINKSASKSKK